MFEIFYLCSEGGNCVLSNLLSRENLRYQSSDSLLSRCHWRRRGCAREAEHVAPKALVSFIDWQFLAILDLHGVRLGCQLCAGAMPEMEQRRDAVFQITSDGLSGIAPKIEGIPSQRHREVSLI